MRQSPSKHPAAVPAVCATIALLATTGCAFDEGDPWGVAEFDVVASFDPPASRLDEGALKTAKDYRVQLDELTATFDVVELQIASGGGEAAGFDPSDPPEGYSLCHAGHCHHDESGNLVAYEEIEIAEAAGDFVVLQGLHSAPTSLEASPHSVALTTCSDDCRLQRGKLSLVQLTVEMVRVAGMVSDVRDRIEPTEFELELELDAVVATTVDGTIARGEPGRVELSVAFELPAAFLDPIDFDPMNAVDPAERARLVRETLEQSNSLTVSIQRHQL